MYNTRITKHWIVRHGGSLPFPPLEVDASHCSGPALFINVPTDEERQIWLWDTQGHLWNPIRIGHVIDLDVKRVVTLSDKNVPVFKAARERRDAKDEVRFIRCQPDNM